MKILSCSLMLVCSLLFGQVRTVSIEEVPIPNTDSWNNPVFSPSGNEIFFTNIRYNGIWEYSFDTKLLKEITTDEHSGFGFTVSEDGTQIAYRRTNIYNDPRDRQQESIVLTLPSNEKTVIDRGNSVSIPVFSRNRAVTAQSLGKVASSAEPIILGIEDAKISILINGEKKTVDPLNGQYIWPSLSPDKKYLSAVEMDRGTFVCSINGSGVQRLGKCNAPVWTRDGKWIIGMDDRDDGHNILDSDIIAVSIDGKQRINLTASFEEIALFPSVSSVKNQIVFSTLSGKIYILSYEEGQ